MTVKKKLQPVEVKCLVLPFHITRLATAESARECLDELLRVRHKIGTAMLGSNLSQREMMTQLVENYVTAMIFLIEQLKITEDPSVAYAIALKQQLEDLRYKLEEVTKDLSEHERRYTHEDNGNYY